MSTLEETLVEKINVLEKRLRLLENVELGPQIIVLTTPLTSTSWDGDAHSDEAAATIDLSAVFGAPPGIKGVFIRARACDSAAAPQTALYVIFGPSTTGLGGAGTFSVELWPYGGDAWKAGSGLVPCDANGDIAYMINASGANTMKVVLEIWGYLL